MRLRWSIKTRDKAVGTIIGATIFLGIFLVSVSLLLFWMQSYANYAGAVLKETGFEVERAREELVLTFLNSTAKLKVIARNPTPYTIIITQVWSNHSFQTGEWVVPAKGSAEINTTLDYVGMALCKVVTSRGNIFSGPQTIGEDLEEYMIEAGRWYVQWYNLSARHVFDMKLGESYWQSLSIAFQWGSTQNDPIFGGYTKVGFNATTRVVALGTKMYINWYVNEDIRVIVKELNLDSGWNTGAGYVELDVARGAVYTVTVLYSRYTEASGAPYMTLNVVNADFMSLLR
ncbi:MAG: hypothetical protein QXM93_08230 [Candidatus Methanomethyliaceae archaeon]